MDEELKFEKQEEKKQKKEEKKFEKEMKKQERETKYQEIKDIIRMNDEKYKAYKKGRKEIEKKYPKFYE